MEVLEGKADRESGIYIEIPRRRSMAHAGILGRRDPVARSGNDLGRLGGGIRPGL